MKIILKPYWQREDGFAATTMAIVLASVAAVTGAVGAISAGMAQKSASDFNAKVAKNNATMAEQQASAQAAQIDKRNRRLRGAQVVAMAKGGLDISSDSADSVLYDSAVSGELDKLTTLYKGRVAATNYNAQAAADSLQGRSAMTAGYFGAGTSLLGGLAQASAYKAMGNANNTPEIS